MKKVNYIISIMFSVITFIMYLLYKDITILVFIPYLFIPYIIKLRSNYTFIYLVFGVLGLFFGFLLHFYKTIYWYDTFVHFIWGFISCFIYLIFMNKFNMSNNKIIFNILLMIIFCMGLSAMWEIIEFISDNLFKSDMQRSLTGVYDTMKDLISAFLGCILFSVSYSYEYLCCKKLIIRRFINKEDLCKIK